MVLRGGILLSQFNEECLPDEALFQCEGGRNIQMQMQCPRLPDGQGTPNVELRSYFTQRPQSEYTQRALISLNAVITPTRMSSKRLLHCQWTAPMEWVLQID
jgi:hypothetical protein